MLHINFYFKNELLMLLERAGFDDVVVHGDHRDEPATRDDDFLLFVAKKRPARYGERLIGTTLLQSPPRQTRI